MLRLYIETIVAIVLVQVFCQPVAWAGDNSIPALWSEHPNLRPTGTVLLSESSGWVVYSVGGASVAHIPDARRQAVGVFTAEQSALAEMVEFLKGTDFLVVEKQESRAEGDRVDETIYVRTEESTEGLIRRAVRASVFRDAKSDSVFVGVVCTQDPLMVNEYVDRTMRVDAGMEEAVVGGVENKNCRDCLFENVLVLTGGTAMCSSWNTVRVIAVGVAELDGDARESRFNAARAAKIDAMRRLAAFTGGQAFRGIEESFEVVQMRNGEVLASSFNAHSHGETSIRDWVGGATYGGSWMNDIKNEIYAVYFFDLLLDR